MSEGYFAVSSAAGALNCGKPSAKKAEHGGSRGTLARGGVGGGVERGQFGVELGTADVAVTGGWVV